MAGVGPAPLQRERWAILSLLIILSVASWSVLIWQSSMMMGMGLTMGMSAGLFLAIWVVMMIAMMFPASAPMILMFATIYASKRQRGQAFVPTWIFVAGYLLVWVLFGVVAYAAAVAVDKLAEQSMWLMENGPRIGGILLILAGLYQFSPLKRACLTKCRTPLQFLMTSWRDGYGGAVRMGLEHGTYCLGCCWFLFVILFPLGLMNIAAMVVLTLLIYIEKSLPLGKQISQVAAIALIAYGLAVTFVPHLLPTTL